MTIGDLHVIADSKRCPITSGMTKEGTGVTKTVIAGSDLITSLPAPTGNLLCRQQEMPDHVGHDEGGIGRDEGITYLL